MGRISTLTFPNEDEGGSMNRRTILLSLGGAIIAASTGFQIFQSANAIPVFDSANYAENLLQAARSLTQIENQIKALQNQAKNLMKLDYNSVPQMNSALTRISGLMDQAQGISFNVNATNANFQQYFPAEYAASVSSDQLVIDARARWANSMDAYRQTMTIQSQVVENVAQDSQLLTEIVSQSQGAQGSLQAQQATNQLLALTAKQQLQISTMMAAQFRAEALEQARAAQGQEQGRASFQKFMGDRKAYTPR
jgi:P-type conjugative transfer protein TrbJ